MRIIPFFEYDGGNVFSFHGKIYRRQSEKLGAGGFGEVHCFVANDQTRVAVKSELISHYGYWSGDEFQQEAQWYQKIYGLGIFSGDPNNYQKPHYILMPYFEGRTLFNYCYTTTKDIFALWIKTADVVNYLHQHHRCIHGDLKSDNVMVGKRTDLPFTKQDNNIFLIDFGLMTRLNTERLMYPHTSENAHIHRQYPPELFSCEYKQTILAHITQDLYALGILLSDLYRMFTLDMNVGNAEEISVVCAVRKNLTKANPIERWSIAKATYFLMVSFFSQIPRSIWINISDDYELNGINHKHFIRDMWRIVSQTAIRLRRIELQSEQEALKQKGSASQTKAQKIAGLKKLESNIQIANPESLRTVTRSIKIRFPDLTAGVFSRRTETLLSELTETTKRLIH